MKRMLVPTILVLLIGASCQKKTLEPAGCQLTTTIDNQTYTYQFDLVGRVTHIARHTVSTDLDYVYAYQGKQATVDITYPDSKTNPLRFHYELTLNEQGYVLTAKETRYNLLANGTQNALLTASHSCTYNQQGYLITHHVDRYTYPPGLPTQQLTKTTDAQLTYQDGNPVTITYLDREANQTMSSTITTNRYGTQSNPVNLSFLLEANPFSYSPDQVLQPFLGKPPRSLITSAELKGTSNMTTTYTYRTNASGQLVQAERAGNSAPFSISFATTCP
ncbi:DUF4595 domain-containing protein [Fibrivirga algicola]|uniref:DUF4595 domain-containing protein n=1 Tax=Fibrivirga algicola TaxID=2950420 RepID=A0ABX0QRE5_9BACT|nr:DUF4595 domain-containing protein [Fibrivirga algicola]NID13442.1 DUF4595 domain-containing protein [Fibrivirga algicola]